MDGIDNNNYYETVFCFVMGYVLQFGGKKIAHNVCLALWDKNLILLGKEGLFCWERRVWSLGLTQFKVFQG